MFLTLDVQAIYAVTLETTLTTARTNAHTVDKGANPLSESGTALPCRLIHV